MQKKTEIITTLNNAFKNQLSHAFQAFGLNNATPQISIKRTREELEETMIWLDGFIKNYGRDLDQHYKQLPVATWDRFNKVYSLHGRKTCPALVALDIKKKAFWDAWKKRPSTLRRLKNESK